MTRLDALLDAYARLYRALLVLHTESDTDLPFGGWVEVVGVRYQPIAKELALPARVCPEDGCVAAYTRDGPVYLMGVDDRRQRVMGQRWRCTDGHWHTIEERDE